MFKNAWRELPETGVDRMTHPRGPSTSAYPASRDSRGAQDEKSETISSKD